MRYYYFFLRFRQWFLNHNGVKAFAEQVMTWLVRDILQLASKLKTENKALAEQIKKMTAELNNRKSHPTIENNEYNALEGKIRLFGFFTILCGLAEGIFNFFATRSLILFHGVWAVVIQLALALVLTWGSIILFENLFEQILNEKPYKSEQKASRDWKKLIILSVLAISYEFLLYYLCVIRGAEIEGSGGNGSIRLSLVIAGMILPILAGYCANERRRLITAYRNTQKIAKLEKDISQKNQKIKSNEEKLEAHFKNICERSWSLHSEFKNYKEVFNLHHNIQEEDLLGHFCEDYPIFVKEAVERSQSNRVTTEVLHPDAIIIPHIPKQLSYSITKNVILLICTASLLSACTQVEKRRNYICLIDRSGSTGKERLQEYIRISSDDVISNLGSNDKITFMFIDGCPLSQSERVFSLDLSKLDFTDKADGQNHQDDSCRVRLSHFINDSIKPAFTKAILRKGERRAECSGNTDIIRTIGEVKKLVIPPQEQSTRFQRFLKYLTEEGGYEYENCLIIFSDMINTDIEEEYNFSKIHLKTDDEISQAIIQLNKSGQIPDLSGAQVFIYGSTGTKHGASLNKQIENARQFWEQFFSHCNSGLRGYGYDIEDEIKVYCFETSVNQKHHAIVHAENSIE